MKWNKTWITGLAMAIIFSFAFNNAAQAGRKGGSHSSSHGGRYSGGSGSAHKGGHYKNSSTGNHYQKRK